MVHKQKPRHCAGACFFVSAPILRMRRGAGMLTKALSSLEISQFLLCHLIVHLLLAKCGV